MNYLDLITATLGLAYIILEYRASIWMWVVGFVMQALGIVLYYQKGLYADCGMEFYYLAMTVYGYTRWIKPPIPPKGEQLPSSKQEEHSASPLGGDGRGAGLITHIPLRVALRWSLLALLLWMVIYLLLVSFTDSNVPAADAFTTALSLIGIWALAHKYLEQWFVWIAVDIVTSVLYFYKDIPFKATLYALYVIIAIMGYRKWRRMMKQTE